jgi:hypothetical protein
VSARKLPLDLENQKRPFDALDPMDWIVMMLCPVGNHHTMPGTQKKSHGE